MTLFTHDALVRMVGHSVNMFRSSRIYTNVPFAEISTHQPIRIHRKKASNHLEESVRSQAHGTSPFVIVA